MVTLMEPSSHPQLVRRAQAGDTQAFQELAIEYRPRIEAVVKVKFAGALRPEDVDDVLQEAFLQALRGIAGFTWKGNESYFRWLSAIAVHIAYKVCRRRKRAGPVLDREPAADGLSESRAMRREERFDRLEAAIDGLSPEHREVLRLVRLEGLPIQEVARRLQKTPNAISRMVLRASRKLKEAFGDTQSLGLPPRRLHDGRAEP